MQSVIKKIHFSYKTLQKIKASEYLRFFSKLENYDLHVNHLGEMQWMTEQEADQQHEFFLHRESSNLLNKIFFTNKTPNLEKASPLEREVRLQIRAYLEKTYLGKITPETQKLFPSTWQFELKTEELLHIPITVDTLKSRDWKKTAAAISILSIIVISLITLFFLRPGEKTGQLLVQSNIEGARIFLDSHLFLGYSGSVIRKIPVGTHQVTVRKDGFVSTPNSQTIEIIDDSLQITHFKLNPLDSHVKGNLKIIADQKDSDLYIDNDYYGKIGDFPVITLEEGQYQVKVNKAGFITLPNEQTVNITAGDTTLISLEQVSSTDQAKLRSLDEAMGSGTLDITSNVSAAQIYLNGKDTGKETDYVFANLPLGSYRIRLVKEGFNCEPEERMVHLTPSDPTGEASFVLRKEFEVVTIETDQPEAQIFVDEEAKGIGKFQAPLSIGKHEISFGHIPGFNAPQKKIINVKARLPLTIEVKYFPQMRMIAEVTNNGNIRSKDCNVRIGYTFSNKGFSPSDEAGPEVVYNENIKNYFWKLGYAFPLRNPKGNDAIQVTFTLPHQLDYEQKFTLKIDAAISKDNYPLTLSRKIDISIKFNNNILSYYYQPKTLEDIGNTEPFEWDITPYIKPSTNSLEIATTEKNNTYYFVKKIEIYN